MNKPSEIGCCGSAFEGCCHDEPKQEEICECGKTECACETEENNQGCGCGCDC